MFGGVARFSRESFVLAGLFAGAWQLIGREQILHYARVRAELGV